MDTKTALQIQKFTFNPFQENTYILFDHTNECIIMDPGMYTEEERKAFTDFILNHDLKPVRLINTHCHLDHIFGNAFINKVYGLGLEIHPGEEPILETGPISSRIYGLQLEKSPSPEKYIQEGDLITFGEQSLQSILTPGHSPASLSFYHESSKCLFSGDVLFYESIGRTDLPGGDYDTLVSSIKTKLFPLGDEVMVYPGHGPPTSLGYEKQHNPFL